MEVLLPAIILEDEEGDLLIHCMSEGTTDIFKERKDEGYYSTLIGRYLADNGMKFREFFSVSRDILHLILTEIKENATTRSCNRWQAPISAEQKLFLTLRYVGVQATIFNIVLLIIQSVINITQKCKYTNHLNSSAKLEVLGSNSSFAPLLPSFPF